MKRKLFTRPVCTLLSEDMYRNIVAVTDQEETSVSEFIRESIKEKLETGAEIMKQKEE